jgi:preprotein translocase subunit SecD
MNNEPKKKFYKRWWFAFLAGLIVGVGGLILVAIIQADQLYLLSPSYWVKHVKETRVQNEITEDYANAAPSYFELKVADAKGDFVPTELDSRYLDKANMVFDPTTGEPTVQLTFSGEGAKLFADTTGQNIGKRIGIFVDDKLVSSPSIQSQITGGTAIIRGNFTLDEAKTLTKQLNAGRNRTPNAK